MPSPAGAGEGGVQSPGRDGALPQDLPAHQRADRRRPLLAVPGECLLSVVDADRGVSLVITLVVHYEPSPGWIECIGGLKIIISVSVSRDQGFSGRPQSF